MKWQWLAKKWRGNLKSWRQRNRRNSIAADSGMWQRQHGGENGETSHEQ